MSKYTITVTKGETEKSTISNIIDESSTCESTKEFTVIVPEGTTKFVSIIKTGYLGSYIGIPGIIKKDTTYSLLIEGEQTTSNPFSGTIIVRIKDYEGGNTEHELILTRAHSNRECTNAA